MARLKGEVTAAKGFDGKIKELLALMSRLFKMAIYLILQMQTLEL